MDERRDDTCSTGVQHVFNYIHTNKQYSEPHAAHSRAACGSAGGLKPKGEHDRSDGGVRGGANAPHAPKGGWVPWRYSELTTVWRHPDMTSRELAEMLPGRTEKAVRRVRERYGRWRLEGVTPLCQRCGEHPVAVSDPRARRWGLCMGCALREKEWLDAHEAEVRRRNDARRQARRRARGDGGVSGDGD